MPFIYTTLAEGTTSTSISDALTQLTSLVSSALAMITGNTVLMVLFCGGLLGVAYRIISQAKRAARN